MTPRLSVVVPFYGVGEYLGACLDSIARQAWTDFEAILVDDGSPDDSAVIAKEFCDTDSRFRLIQQPNAGPGPARRYPRGHRGVPRVRRRRRPGLAVRVRRPGQDAGPDRVRLRRR